MMLISQNMIVDAMLLFTLFKCLVWTEMDGQINLKMVTITVTLMVLEVSFVQNSIFKRQTNMLGNQFHIHVTNQTDMDNTDHVIELDNVL